MSGFFEAKHKVTRKNLYRSDLYNLILLRSGFLGANIDGIDVSCTGPCIIFLRSGLSVENVSVYRHDKEVIRFGLDYIDPSVTSDFVTSGGYSERAEELGFPRLEPFVKQSGRFSYGIPLEPEELSRTEDFLQGIFSQSEQFVKAYFCLLLEYLYGIYGKYIVGTPRFGDIRSSEVFVNLILNSIYRDYRDKISLITLSSQVGINKTAVAKAFRAACGVSIADYIIIYRIRCVNILLSSTKLTLRELCTLCGFNSEAYLIKQYGNRTGITPAAYRKATEAKKLTMNK